jgi:fructose-1,6-bisphosphatase/inositol monophosphatase family enzyme
MRACGSGSVELSWVAAGRLGGYLQVNCLPWDWLPGAALVTAAGGATAVVEQDGQRWHVAGPARLVADVTERLAADDGQPAQHQ